MEPWTSRVKHLLAAPGTRISVGLAVTGVAALLALSAARLPFLVLSSPHRTISLYGGAATENLSLGLIAAGALTALAGLLHALGRPALRIALLVPGPIAGLFCLLSWLSMSSRLAHPYVTDRALWATLGSAPIQTQLGSGFTLSMLASALLLALGVIASLGPGTPPPGQRQSTKRRVGLSRARSDGYSQR